MTDQKQGAAPDAWVRVIQGRSGLVAAGWQAGHERPDMSGDWKPLYLDPSGTIAAQSAELESLREQVRELKERVGKAGYCAFCGETIPPSIDFIEHAAMRAHVEVCPKHPLAGVRAENEAIRQALVTAEFMTGDPGDLSDVLDVLGAFIEHHKGKEAEVKRLREALEITRREGRASMRSSFGRRAQVCEDRARRRPIRQAGGDRWDKMDIVAALMLGGCALALIGFLYYLYPDG